MALSAGKQKGLEAVSDRRGVIAALAIDQRSALRGLFSKASGLAPKDVNPEWIIRFKEVVSRILTPYASAILLDPEFGLPAAAQRATNSGLLLAYEKTGYDKTVKGRLPAVLDGFSVKRLQQEGADCIKVLLYYSPFSAMEINSVKHDWVERVGAECANADIPFFLEIVSYHDEMDEKGAEFARIKPQSVTCAIEEFCKPRYKVDVVKVGVPVNLMFVEGQNKYRNRRDLHTARGDRAFSSSVAGSNVAVHLSFRGRQQRNISICAGTGSGSRCEILWSVVRTRELEGRSASFC